MISLILFAMAAVCNAAMDVCSHHFYQSVFNSHKLDKAWWNAEGGSWRNKYIVGDPAFCRRKIKGTDINYPVQLTDAWHFFKSLMVIFLALSAVTARYNIEVGRTDFLDIILWFVAYGVCWNCTFSLFYNKIFRK